MRYFFIVVIACLLEGQVHGHEPVGILNLGLSENDTIHDSEKSKLVPALFPGYSPELGFNIGGGVFWTFKTELGDKELFRSTVPFGITYGFKGAVSVKANWVTFWNHNNLRIYSDWYYRNMNDHYYGVGYDAGSTTLKGDSTTKYKREWWQFDTRIVFLIEENLYGGFRLDLNSTRAKNVNPKMAQDPYYLQYGPDNRNSGIGLVIQYDSRDFPQNAFSGMLYSMTITSYGNYMGGENYYTTLDFDVRKYWKLNMNKDRVLAAWFKSRLAGGKVPYPELSQLGPNDLRGYYWGQYRDAAVTFGLVEYRHKFYRSSGKASRSGFVAWTGLAAISPDFGNVDVRNFLYNVGYGYRFELQPRLNVRADFGYGFNTSLFYFGFTEQF